MEISLPPPTGIRPEIDSLENDQTIRSFDWEGGRLESRFMSTNAAGPQPEKTDPGEEWVDLIDEENRVIGRKTRREIRTQNLLHRGVGIICFNPDGDVYVHRRTETKDVFPGMYDMFVGGVVASGEAYETAAAREILEELGIDGPSPEYLFSHLYEGPRNRSWIQVFRAVWDGPIVHQEEEIAWGTWLPGAELESWAEAHSIVPDGLEVFEHYLEWLKNSS